MRRAYPKRIRIHLIRMNEERVLPVGRTTLATPGGLANVGTVELHWEAKNLLDALVAIEIRRRTRARVFAGEGCHEC